MAEAKIQLGGVLDIASGSELDDRFNKLHGALAGAGKPKRIMRPLSKSQTALNLTQGQSVQVPIGRPSAGRIWVLTRVTALGDDDTTAKTGLSAAIYIGDDANVGISQCVRNGQAIPFTTTENEHAYVVHDRETLFANLVATGTGPITGQVVINCLVWEYRDVDIDGQFL